MLRPIFVLLFGLLSSFAILAADEKYAEALSLRNNKVAGLSQSESSARAEQLFWEVAKAGNPKAMHNYALIQDSKGNYDLAYAWFIKAGLEASLRNAERMLTQGKVKRELNLIVGSTRKAKIRQGRLVDAFYGAGVDLSHRHTFGGQATTMDVLPSVKRGKAHIEGDVETFDFSKYVINAAFLEQLPTMRDEGVLEVGMLQSNQAQQVLRGLKHNFIGSSIANISKSMRPHATMEIEWQPYLGLYGWGRAELEDCVRSNPFHCFFNIDTVFQAMFFLGGDKKNIETLPEETKEATLEMVEKIRSLLEFYHAQGVGESVDELISTLYWETRVVFEMTLTRLHVLLEYKPGEQDGKKLKAMFDQAFWESFPSELVGVRVRLNDGGKELYTTGHLF